ncbi:hypothetical protein [Aquidulcibacter sp.]|jgi:hypothetical protein|uniref:hypothetical protein n=1 Tax=Aquidulcibacter sp. TaxID=2052990 RepID=UPI0037C19B64
MLSQAKRLLLSVTCLAFSVGSAFADSSNPTSNDPMIAYRAYDQAVADGKLVDAAAYAQVAWKNAETTWGPTNANTAGLAFNAAWSLALIGKAPEGLEPAKRAVELAEVGAKAYKAPEAQFLLAYAEFEAATTRQLPKKAQAIDVAAQAVEGAWGDMLVADALLRASIHFSVTGRSSLGAKLAERSAAEVQRLNPKDVDRLALVNLARAVSKLSDQNKLLVAYEDILKARVAYGPMRQSDDPTWGALSAWQMVVNGLIQATNSANGGTASRIKWSRSEPRDMTEEEVAKVMSPKPECAGFTKFKRKRVGRDIEPMQVGYFTVNLGGVQVLTDLAPDGKVIRPRVIGAVPDSSYGEATLNGISTWQFDLPANVPAPCLKDYDISVVFTMY